MTTDQTPHVGALRLRDRVTLQDGGGTDWTGIVIELSLTGSAPPGPSTITLVTLRTDDGEEPMFQRLMSDPVTMVRA